MKLSSSTLLLEARLADIERSFGSVLQDYERENLPDCLYHYTTWGGFCGIVKSQKFWATDHHDTNDPNEMKSVDELILGAAERLRASLHPMNTRGLSSFIENYGSTRFPDRTPVYLTCFSATPGNQHLWCEYADREGGVCLGIPLLNEKPPEEEQARLSRRLCRVRYSKDVLKSEIETLFSGVCEMNLRLKRSHGDLETPLEKQTHMALVIAAALVSCSAKEPKWDPEGECRQIVIPSYRDPPKPLTRTRESDGKTIHYLELRARAQGRIALSKVLLGSKCPRSTADAQEELRNAGYRDDMPPIIPWSLSPG
jgi:hypothetical protein